MDLKYQSLFTPWKIGNLTIKNRIVMCPMGGTSLFGWMEPNHFDKIAADFFLEKAQNNVGLIIPGIAPLRDTFGNRWLYQNKTMFKKLKPYMEQIHQTGAKLFVQLTAGFGRSFALTNSIVPLLKYKPLGILASPVINVSAICASPSKLPSRWAEDVMCREIKVKEIKKLIEAFAKTAKLCKEAGVDGVEVHAVHEGYLMDQFTLPYTNHRQDEYGGSFENRYRFAVEVVKAIKEACGKDYPVSLRYSVVSKTKGFNSGAVYGENDYVEVGRDLKESEKAAKYAYELKNEVLITNDKQLKKNKTGNPKRISDSQIAFRCGYLKARSDNAKAFNYNKVKAERVIRSKPFAVLMPKADFKTYFNNNQ